jgi:hypothetical protein
MSNQYIQQLSELLTASGNFIIPISDDPNGTSTLKKITVTNLFSGLSNSAGSGVLWGAITGTLSNQTDLQTALNAKANSSSLGTAAGLNSGNFVQVANNLSDIVASTARTNLGLGTSALLNSGNFLQTINNLADVNASTARSNLGLGQAALYNSGTIFYNTPLSGIPTAPTAANGTNTTQLATTQFVTTAVANASGGVTSVNTRTGPVVLTAADVGLSNATTQGNTFNGNSQLVQLTAAGKYPALDGSLITNLTVSGAATNSSGLVISVAGRSGAVTLTTADIGGLGQVALYNSGQIFYNTPLSGVPTAPTAAYGTNSTQLATTAFVSTAIASVSGGTSVAPTIPAYSHYANSTNISGPASGIQTLVLGTPNFTVPVNTLVGQLTSNVNNYSQFIIQNTSKDVNASTDIILNNDLGNDSTWYLNLGINSSSGGVAPFFASGAAYLYASDSNELNIGCHGPSGTIQFWIGSGVTRAGWFDSGSNLNLTNNLTSNGTISGVTLLVNNTTCYNGVATNPASSFQWLGQTRLKSPLDGIFQVINQAQTDFNRIVLGSGTAQFPSLKRSGNALAVRLGDDSADAGLSASTLILSANGIAGSGALTFPGSPYSGGTTTTNTPLLYLNTSGTTAPTTFIAGGTYIGVNAFNTFAGNFIDFHTNGGASLFSVSSAGAITCASSVNAGANTITCGSISSSSKISTSYAGAAGNAALAITGLIYSGGTGTTSFPQYLSQSSTNTAAATTWNPSGTFFGVNAPNNFFGNYVDYRKNGGPSLLSVDYLGNLYNFGAQHSGSVLVSASGTPNSGALMLTGSVYSGGTATTNTPLLYIKGSGSTAVSSWHSNGTYIGIDGVPGFVGNLIDLHINGGTSLFSINSNGSITNAGNNTFAGGNILSYVGAASTSVIRTNAAPYSAGTTTTNFPQYLAQTASATAVTNWSIYGTYFGVNTNPAFSGNFIDLHTNGGNSLFGINYSGLVNAVSLQLINSSTLSSILKTNASGLIIQAVSGTDYVTPTATTAYSGQHYIPPVSLTPGTTVNWNMDTAPNALLSVPSGAFTLANPTNIRAGAGGMLTITQSSSSGTLGVITWGSAYKFPSGSKFVLTTTISAVDEISWYSPDGTNVHCTGLGDFR